MKHIYIYTIGLEKRYLPEMLPIEIKVSTILNYAEPINSEHNNNIWLGLQSIRVNKVAILSVSRLIEQPIMRIEDRLFDRGWVRSAMATRKCGNIYFRKYFMAVRKFTNIFVLLLILINGRFT